MNLLAIVFAGIGLACLPHSACALLARYASKTRTRLPAFRHCASAVQPSFAIASSILYACRRYSLTDSAAKRRIRACMHVVAWYYTAERLLSAFQHTIGCSSVSSMCLLHEHVVCARRIAASPVHFVFIRLVGLERERERVDIFLGFPRPKQMTLCFSLNFLRNVAKHRY